MLVFICCLSQDLVPLDVSRQSGMSRKEVALPMLSRRVLVVAVVLTAGIYSVLSSSE